MAHYARSSGNLAADRRYDYARHSAAEGDHAVAADLLMQTVELAPSWPAAWFALGEAREASGDATGAIAAFERTALLDPEGSFGSTLRLARLGAQASPASPPDAYVRDLFDQYAERFERHLLKGLAYRGPRILAGTIDRACLATGRPNRFGTAIDLGCGTGLAAQEIGPRCEVMDGVDLAPAMVALAKATGLYRKLEAAEMRAFLEDYADATVDLVLAADVFVYLGDLEPLFAQVARVLCSGGMFGFTVQVATGPEFNLGPDLRYTHSRVYLERLAHLHGWSIAALDEASIRQDRGIDVPGLALVMAAP
ncbi:MAG: biotin biosynthesis protein BioC [Hyphomicrobiales bacterium]|nr:biotin biosynthesis protein BioC [Hyphomicrobiales bacterium]